MRLKINKPGKIKEKLVSITNFRGGSNSLVDEARQDTKYTPEVNNMWQVQDGLWQTRPGTAYYGEAIPGESSIDGAGTYLKSDGTNELIAIGGTTGKVFKSVDGGSWSEISGATFTTGNQAYFLQIKSKLYITNGVDKLTRYDGSSLTTYSSLSAPANLSGTRGAGLSAGDYTAYYTVTALNDIGETAASAEESVSIDIQRDSWTASDEKIDLDWDAVGGAVRYNIYYSDSSGYEVYVGTSTTNAWTDDGSNTPNDYLETPDDNTTEAPKIKSLELSGNRIWGTNDADNEYRVHFTGTGQYAEFFSPFYGGGWFDVEKGGKFKPKAVVHFRAGDGSSVPTILCNSPEGLGCIWQVDLASTTVGDVTFSIPSPYKIVGSAGTNAPLSVAKARDNVMFTNLKGVFALRNKPQMFQVLATDEMSVAIRPDYLSLRGSAMDGVCSYYRNGRVFFSFPSGSDTNNLMAIFDFERQNWAWSWGIGYRQLLEYTDSNGDTKFLGVPVDDNRLQEITENVTGDLGVPFYQSYRSPLLPVSKNMTDVLKLKEAILELNRPTGSINFSVSGITKGGSNVNLASETISDTVSQTGFSWDLFSGVQFSNTSGTPQSYTQARVRRAIRVRDKVYNLQFKVYSESANTKYTILGLQANGYLLPSRSPSGWRD